MDRDQRQDLCIERWKNAKGRGILELCVGFGKTRTALKIMQKMVSKKQDSKFIIIVPTEYLKGQWLLQLADWHLLHNTDILIINSAVGKTSECDLLIVDEVHEACNDNRIQIFSTFKYRFCLGLSGSLDRLDGKEKQLFELLPIVDTIEYSEALTYGWVAKANEYKVLLNVDLTEYKAAHTKFLHHFAFFNYDFDLAMKVFDKDVRMKFIVAKILGQPLKDVMLHAAQFMKALTARKSFVYNHPQKIEVAKLIISNRKDKKIITFSQTKAMAEAIGEGLLMHSGQAKKKREQIMADFCKMETGSLHSAKQLERGADVPGLNLAINLAFNSSKITKTQKSGRITRKEGDKVADMFTLVIKGTMEEGWYDKSMGKTPYVTIDESQLASLLAGEEFTTRKEKKKEYLFSI